MKSWVERTGWNKILWALWAVLMVLGLWGVGLRLTREHELAAYGSYVTWGLWVAAYIYFIGLSAGAFLLSSLVYVFQVERLKKVGKISLVLAIITLFMALLSIWFDLGHMERFYYVYTHPNFRSMMAWMVWLYTAYFLLLLAETWLALRPDLVRLSQGTGFRASLARFLLFGQHTYDEETARKDARRLRILGTIGVPLAIAFHGGVGALFATVVARPYWHTPLYPILFLTGALVSGGAFLLAVIAMFWPQDDPDYPDLVNLLSKIVVGLLLFDLILEWAEYSIPMWYGVGHEFELLKLVLFGPYWWVFWILHLLLGALIPLWLLTRKNPIAQGFGGLLVALTFMAVRLNIVVPGLVEPALRGLEHAFRDHRLRFEYVPSFFEWQVVFFVIALGYLLFMLGVKLFPILGNNREAYHGG